MIVVAVGWIMFSISMQRVFLTASTEDLLFYVLLLTLATVIMLAGYLFSLVVMGGATRTLVANLLRNDPVTARATYNAVKSRFWGLVGASFIVLAWIFAALIVASTGGQAVLAIFFFGLALMFSVGPPWLGAILMVLGGLVATCFSIWLFFLVGGRVAYIHQAMLVEGKGVFEAVGRSFSLARGNVRRLMAVTLFTTFGILSALMLLFLLISFVGWFTGIEWNNSAAWPAWFTIAYSILGPISAILLTPIWMLGLSLLYVDERVRHEGYDIELMATRQLSEFPDVNVISPLGTALHSIERNQPPPAPRSSGSVLNLS